MPLIIQEEINQHASWGLWLISEDMESLLGSTDLSLQEQAELEQIKTPQKQLEWITSRRILKVLAESKGVRQVEIKKDPFGKPYLTGSGVHISLSHSYPYAAAIIHTQKATGIDIEHSREQLLRVRHKFLCEQELNCAGNHQAKLCVYWAAKEALYKLYGKKGLSLSEQIVIAPFELAEKGVLEGQLLLNGAKQQYTLHYRQYKGLYICFSL